MTWYSGDTQSTLFGTFNYLRAKLELNSYVKKMLVKTVTYTGGSGTLPAVGQTITWDSAASSGTLVQQVSGDNASGVMKINVGTGELESNDSLAHSGGWSASISSLSDVQYVVQGPGPSSGREFYLGLFTGYTGHTEVSYPYIYLALLTGYSAGNYLISQQPGYSSSAVVGMPSSDSVTGTLWLSVTSTRFILVDKLSTYYHMISGGVMTALATDAQYGYPIYGWGSGGDVLASFPPYNNTSNTGWNVLEAFAIRDPSGNYINPSRNKNWSYVAATTDVLKTVGDDYDVIRPIFVSQGTGTATNAVYGYIPGIAGGPLGTAESTYTVGGDTYIMFPNVATTTYPSDMTLVKQA